MKLENTIPVTSKRQSKLAKLISALFTERDDDIVVGTVTIPEDQGETAAFQAACDTLEARDAVEDRETILKRRKRQLGVIASGCYLTLSREEGRLLWKDCVALGMKPNSMVLRSTKIPTRGIKAESAGKLVTFSLIEMG